MKLLPILLLFLILTFTSNLQAQKTQSDSLELKQYKTDIAVKTGVGVFSHTVGFIHLYNGYYYDPARWNSFILYNSVGLTFDIFALIKWNQYRQFKRDNGFLKTSYN